MAGSTHWERGKCGVKCGNVSTQSPLERIRTAEGADTTIIWIFHFVIILPRRDEQTQPPRRIGGTYYAAIARKNNPISKQIGIFIIQNRDSKIIINHMIMLIFFSSLPQNFQILGIRRRHGDWRPSGTFQRETPQQFIGGLRLSKTARQACHTAAERIAPISVGDSVVAHRHIFGQDIALNGIMAPHQLIGLIGVTAQDSPQNEFMVPLIRFLPAVAAELEAPVGDKRQDELGGQFDQNGIVGSRRPV
jgi:hypothetical protein